MPQSKKRKKTTVSRKTAKSYVHLSKHYMDDYEKVVYQIMQMAGVDVQLYEKLTKRVRHRIMELRFTPFRIITPKGQKVPKSYIQFFSKVVKEFEENTYYGNPEYKVKYKHYILYGIPFLLLFQGLELLDSVTTEKDTALLEQIKKPLQKLEEEYEQDYYLCKINQMMQIVLMFVSTPIYRYYTCKVETITDENKLRLQQTVYVSSFEPETRMFKIQNERHKGYRLWKYELNLETYNPNPVETFVPQVSLEVDDIETATQILKESADKKLMPVYVQAHVIHRMRQRLDTMDNNFINQIISASIILPESLTAKTGQRLLKAIDLQRKIVGYFPFIVENGAILLRSFLPLSSPITPEGHQLKKILGIQMEDSKYIGLDKLSFYAKTDFEQLPHLKKALEKANMWHLTEIISSESVERSEDRILERFFTGYKIIDQREPLLI